nr:uncharacterized protein LOC113824027 [Penaeus vannamei]
MLAAGLEHIRFTIPVDIPGWLASGGSMSSSSATSMSVSSMGSSIPSPSQHDFPDLDTTCSEALEESWGSKKKRRSRSSSQSSSRVSSGARRPLMPRAQTLARRK